MTPDPGGNNQSTMAGAVQGRSRLLSTLFDAFNARDVDRIASHYHPAAELWLTEMYTPAGTVYHGREGLRTLLEDVLPRLGNVRLEVADMREFEESVLALVDVHIDDISRRAYLLYTFKDGLIKRLEEFDSEAGAVRAGERPHLLTPRERQVFALLARGKSGPEIAAQLVLSPETIRTHVQNGVERLGARTRVQAVAIALDRGEISI